VADCHAFRRDRDRLLLQLVRGAARMGRLLHRPIPRL